jgi:RimJ/RimL family protein N-acetyltransferase
MIAAMLRDPVVSGPMGIPEPRITTEDLRLVKESRAQRTDAGDWTAFVRARHDEHEEVFAGEVGVVEWDSDMLVAEVFVAIIPDLGGSGYGREAVSRLTEHIFRSVPLACVRTQALITNARALALATSLGFRETGRRFVLPNLESGFVGGTAAVLDCRAHHFQPFSLSDEDNSRKKPR